MAEYIDKNKAINAVFEAFADGRSAYIALEAIPAADVQPVRHGQWKEWNEAGMYIVCSSCGEPFSKLDVLGRKQAKRFCSNCGANMREVPRE